MRPVALALLAAACSACSSGDAYVVITVDARPAVQNAATLRVTLTNGGATLSDDLALAGHALPVTFSVSSPTSTGDLTIGIAALDGSADLVGQGSVTTALDAGAAAVTLDTADFVVNTEYPMDQLLADDFEATGTQIAASPDQIWTVSFRDDCASPCNMHARRFDQTGAPVTTVLGAGTNQFDVSTTLTDTFSTTTMTASASASLALWDSHDDTTSPATDGIACRALDGSGNATAAETPIAAATEVGTDVVSATPMGNGNFAVVWDSFPTSTATSLAIRGAIVGPDCAPLAPPITLSGSASSDPHRSHVASAGNALLYAWIDSGDVHVRATTSSNVPTTVDTTLLRHTATSSLEHVRLASLGAAGYAVFVRWYSDTDATAPGKIELYRVSAAGVALGPPTLVTDKSGSDFASQFSFGVAVRSDGALLVTWHACGDNGDGQGCGVFARVFRPSGAPVGDAFGVPTTTLTDQTNPSAAALTDSFAVAWNDMSATMPDVSGLAVRARIIYPPYDDAEAIAGAACGSGQPACAAPLVCGTGSDGARCSEPCGAGNSCPDGGTCTAGACVY